MFLHVFFVLWEEENLRKYRQELQSLPRKGWIPWIEKCLQWVTMLATTPLSLYLYYIREKEETKTDNTANTDELTPQQLYNQHQTVPSL